jgi:hypothetical protein
LARWAVIFYHINAKLNKDASKVTAIINSL